VTPSNLLKHIIFYNFGVFFLPYVIAMGVPRAWGMGHRAWSMGSLFFLLQIDNNYIGARDVLNWESF